MNRTAEFEVAGHQVSARLCVRQAVRWANRSVGWVTGGIVSGLLVIGWLFPGIEPWAVALGGVVGWAVACGGWAWMRRPDVHSALAHWDAVSAIPGSLASAEWFAKRPVLTPGEELHLREASGILRQRSGQIASEVPSGKPSRSWWILLVLPVVAVSGLGRREIAWEERSLTPEMRAAAAALAEELESARQEMSADADEIMDDPSVAGRLEELLADTGGLLTEPGKATTGQVLDALEARASAVEAMAKQFQGEGDWVPAAVLEELERHADTARLAGQIRERNPSGSAVESDQLAEALRNDAAASRVEHALGESTRRANEEEVRQPVLRHLGGALDFLQRKESGLAENEFRELGDYFRGLERKRAVRETLDSLARQLRSGGEKLAGGGNQAAREAGPSMVPPAGVEPLAAQAPPSGAEGNAAGEGGAEAGEGSVAQAAPPPPGGALPGDLAAAPVPGTAAPVPGVAPAAPSPLTAPVPGALPGSSSLALSAPVPGQAGAGTGVPGSNPGGVPGLNAGEGTAEMRADPTKALSSTRDDLVIASGGGEGDSEMKAVKGDQVRGESATRAARETAADFTAVEESALYEESIPAARRDQVRRYFSALRERFEEAENAGGTAAPGR